MTEPVTDTTDADVEPKADQEVDADDVVEDTPAYAALSLHQPRRGLIAAGEVVVVVVLAFVAVWCWNRGITHLSYPIEGRDPLISTRYHGNWLGTAALCVTMAAVLLLDAARQVVLAARTRPRKAADDDV